MTTTDPLARISTKRTHQTHQAIDRPEQVKNNAGGYVFQIEPLAQFRRFLTIGTAGGTYYVDENTLSEECARLVIGLTGDNTTQRRAIDVLVELSLAGRAPKQNPTLFALAIFCQMGDTASKQYARSKINEVVRTGTHLFIFVGYLKQFGGWSMGLRKAIAKWYTEKDSDQLAYQLVKYRSREGWTHRDVLRIAHPKIEEPLKRNTVDWAVQGNKFTEDVQVPMVLAQHANAMAGNYLEALDWFNLPWEALPDEAMNDRAVWEKMLSNGMPPGALLRQLPRLTNLGMFDPLKGGNWAGQVADLLNNHEMLRKARIHPFNVLVALKTYRSGQGFRSTWTPAAKIIDALDEMFYASFDFVEPTGKRTMLNLDVSSSMAAYQAGKLPISCREASAALAMVSERTESDVLVTGFTSNRAYDRGNTGITVLPISSRQRLDDVVQTISGLPWGGTDCALPMILAKEQKLEVDTFVIYTDNDTWAGRIHPYQALRDYRQSSGIDAKLVVCSMIPSKFSIADPRDPGMLDISGLDSAVPNLISDFSAGRM